MNNREKTGRNFLDDAHSGKLARTHAEHRAPRDTVQYEGKETCGAV